MEFVTNFFTLLNESAPWLLLGLLIAGIIKAYIPEDYLTRHLGGKGMKATIKAALIGAPLPLCSCGVVPAALSIRRAGGSKNATVSFLIATPETGIDSMGITYALMGPFMTIIRPIAAIFSAIFAGFLVGKSEGGETVEATKKTDSPSSCCKTEKPSCCDTPKQAVQTPATNKLKQGINFAFFDMFDDIFIWLFVGLLFAAIIQTYVPSSFLTQYGDSWMAFILMAVIGVPMYICATASTPIAAGFLLSGVSPGAVLVFMLTGPATNIGTLGIIYNELGKRPLIAYLSGIVICSFAFGALTNYLFSVFNFPMLSSVSDQHLHASWLQIASSVLIIGLSFIAFYKKFLRA